MEKLLPNALGVAAAYVALERGDDLLAACRSDGCKAGV